MKIHEILESQCDNYPMHCMGMRFSEFQITPRACIKFDDRWSQEASSEDSIARPLNESTEEEDADANEIQSFIEQYVTDPNSLTVGEQYYAISLFAKPYAKLLQIEYTAEPVIYSGIKGTAFEFGGATEEYCFQLPINYIELNNEYAPYATTTIVYATADECNKLLTHIGLQFTGRWRVSQRKLPILRIRK